MAQKLTFIDFFCGAGGLTLGFEQAGFMSLLGVDADARALNSYAANFPSPRRSSPISPTSPGRRCWSRRTL